MEENDIRLVEEDLKTEKNPEELNEETQPDPDSPKDSEIKPPTEEEARAARKERRRRITARVFRSVVWGGMAIVIAIIIFFVINVVNDMPSLAELENPKNDLSTQIYTSDGVLIRSLYTEKNRINVPLEYISPYVVEALIATEDIRFYDHSGVDPMALLAVLKDVILSGEKRGGSTITMQLSRNLYNQVGKKKTIFRKVKEMIVAVILERRFTKDEIVTSYLNTVSFVGNSYGVQNAARIYFQKEAIDLEQHEAALLVGILKGTYEYNPRTHPDRAMDRRNTVIDQMQKYGFVTDFQADSLKALGLGVTYRQDDFNNGMAPYFTEHVRMWMRDWCKENDYDLYTDGLKIYTTLDSRLQTHAEAAVAEHLSDLQQKFDKHIEDREAWRKDTTILTRAMQQSYRYIRAKNAGKTDDQIWEEFHTPIPMEVFSWNGAIDTTFSPMDSIKYYSRFLETGFMTIDPSNGQIRTWVGGIDHRFFKYDHVYKGKRQVGSTFKPFVYTAAFDNGYSPCHQMLNQQVFFYDNDGELAWAPKNSDGRVSGYMTLRRGLATSTNLITARIMKEIGPEVVCRYAYKMGIKSTLDCVPSLALGTTDLSVYELTGAYGTFANRGVWVEPNFITRIEDRNGNIIYENVAEQREAISENTAYMMINMLMGVVREPGGTAASLPGRYKLWNEIGGKTGTTQNQSDGWFMGVTPSLVGGTWVGCSDRSMRFRSLQYGQGARMALPIFGLFLKNAYADSTLALPRDPFPQPRGFDVELDCDKFQLLQFAQKRDSATNSTTIKSSFDYDD